MARTRIASRPYLCWKCRGDILPGQEYILVGRGKIHHSPDCEHAEPVDLIFPSHMSLDPYWKRFQLEPPRLIRTYSRIAEKSYTCMSCDLSGNWLQQALSEILPGDRYDAEVYVSKFGWEMRRYHESCPWAPDPEDIKRERERKKDVQTQKRAA